MKHWWNDDKLTLENQQNNTTGKITLKYKPRDTLVDHNSDKPLPKYCS